MNDIIIRCIEQTIASYHGLRIAISRVGDEYHATGDETALVRLILWLDYSRRFVMHRYQGQDEKGDRTVIFIRRVEAVA